MRLTFKLSYEDIISKTFFIRERMAKILYYSQVEGIMASGHVLWSNSPRTIANNIV